MKLFVTNFDEQFNIADMANLFVGYGHVEYIRLGQSKKGRYGIVEMSSRSGGERAVDGLNGEVVRELALRVQESQWK